MNTVTVLYFFLATLFSVLFVYFQYFFKEKKFTNRNLVAFLRFVSYLSFFVLLINPKIVRKKWITVKPELILAVDNSESILLNKQDSLVRSMHTILKDNKELNKKFRISSYSFGTSLQHTSSFNFQENRTNIYRALTDLNSLFKKETAPIVMITDGNQTYGNDYKYYRSNQPVFPIIIGDTIQPADLKIDRINVNSFSYLNNTFPVEIFAQYKGREKIKTKLTVTEKGTIIFSKLLLFTTNKKSAHITFHLPSESIGKHLYKVILRPFENEENTINNVKNFYVKVIDEQSNIALVYDGLHPDIGMLKRSIEVNKQRKVNLVDLNALEPVKEEQDVYILYQPTRKFKDIFKEIIARGKSYFVITGTTTDWSFLNEIQSDFKNTITQSTEKYFPQFDMKFNTFYVEDIGFSDFPPLENKFGNITFSTAIHPILENRVNGIELEYPMLAVFTNGKSRRAILFGENIWRWRNSYYAVNKSFVPFDRFINSIMQFLSVQQRKVPIELDYRSFYHANEQITIQAKTYDSNFNFDSNAELELKFIGNSKSYPFLLTGFNYEVHISDLNTGNYEFVVKNIKNRNQVKGSFTIGEFSVEQEPGYANSTDLKTLSKNAKGSIFYPDQLDKIINFLVENKKFVSIQKEVTSKESFIDWKWLLGLIIVSLSLEWFIRKYRGLV